MIWKPPRSLISILLLAGLLVALLAVDLVLAWTLTRSDVSLRALALAVIIALSLPVLAVLAYWLWGALTLRYTLDRNALTVYWAGATHIIPLPTVQRLVLGSDLSAEPRVQGLRLPGYTVGQADLPDLGRTLVFSTRPLAEQVFVVTPLQTYALSPADPAAFAAEVTTRQRLGPTEYVPQTVRVAPWLALPIWRDRTAHLLLGVAALACLALYAWVVARYPDLPAQLPLRGPTLPPLARVAALLLPTIGLGALVGNGLLAALVHARERGAALLLLGGALAVQALLWVAVWRGLS